MASWAEVSFLPARTAGARSNPAMNARYLEGPWNGERAFSHYKGVQQEGPCLLHEQVDRHIASVYLRPFLHPQSTVNRCHDRILSRSRIVSAFRVHIFARFPFREISTRRPVSRGWGGTETSTRKVILDVFRSCSPGEEKRRLESLIFSVRLSFFYSSLLNGDIGDDIYPKKKFYLQYATLDWR